VKVFFISDLHFDGSKLLSVRKEFESLDEMNGYMINQWNSVVRKEDEVYIVGDLVDKECNDPMKFVTCLNGKKHLIVGNHDVWVDKDVRPLKVFESISNFKCVNIDDYKVTLCHYPLIEWPDSINDEMSIHIHGHIHTRKERLAYKIIRKKCIRAYNASVDVNGLPVTIDELIRNNKKWYGW